MSSTVPVSWQKRALGWSRDLLIFAAMVWVINWWQTKDMLSAAGDVQIPSLQLARLDGSATDLLAPAANKPTILYFFAPWCSVCRLSINNLEYVDPNNANVYVIALDYANTNEVQAFVDDVGLTLPVHMGYDELKQMFQIRAYPSYFVLDENFIVRDRTLGYSTALGLKARSL
jgi:thiol-disulfide isomerase/thioredoxin